MLISYNWLGNYIEHGLSAEEVADILTNIGLEVEGIEKYSNYKKVPDGLVTGEVITVEKHPNADRLTVCRVNIGVETPLQIICGAPNVATGQKVVVAPVGTELTLKNGEKLTLSRVKMRGVESEGMICAEDEIGMGDSHEGIMVLPENTPVGIPYKQTLDLYEDFLIEVSVTPNRGDALSYIGVARELAAFLEKPLKYPEFTEIIPAKESFQFEIAVDAPELCPRYSALVMTGITISDSPVWLQNKLKAAGFNPVNNVVDITNFVLHELGQPLHAFDLEKLAGGKIVVRREKEGSSFTTLDGKDLMLNGSEIMICDAQKAVAMGGVMGGKNSMITEETTAILLESAHFNPSAIRRAARFHGLNTDASYRFERISDPEITVNALKRAAALLHEVCGAGAASEILDCYPDRKELKMIQLNFEFLNRVAGTGIPKESAANILTRLGFGIVEKNDDFLIVEVPSFRPDITIPVDLVEEVIRIYSFAKIPLPERITSILHPRQSLARTKLVSAISSFLSANGFFEILTPSFTSSAVSEILGHDENKFPVKILNNANVHLDTLRDRFVYSALDSIRYNLNRGRDVIKFFEFGKIYFRDNKGKFCEHEILGLWVTGNQHETNWYEKGKASDFFHLKAFLEKIFEKAGITHDWLTLETIDEAFEYGIDYIGNILKLAVMGRVNEKLLQYFDIHRDVFYAEIYPERLVSSFEGHKVTYRSPSKFPFMLRDLSLILDKSVRFEEVKKQVFAVKNKLLKEVTLIDVYEGESIPEAKISYTLRMKFQDDEKTLKDEEVDAVINQAVKLLEKEFKAVIRK